MIETQNRIRVLYILGWGRSGSTILGNILGELDDFIHVGEVRTVWDSALEGMRCGCGEPVPKCPLWSEVLEQVLADEEDHRDVALREWIALRERVDRTRYVPPLLGMGTRALEPFLSRHLRHLAALYRAIRQVTGCRMIVDSSKMPSHALLLGMLPGVELYMVHLVRDPRATAYAWRKFRP
ncbi:MAG: sulfotransferase, partial [Chloroflexi bacterium]|nr:sulfotransferase [Chloroflexota bacterium]